MCILPKAPRIPKQPPPAQTQSMQMPKDLVANRDRRRRRRGLWASIFTSPAGISTPPTVTGGGGSITGG